MDNIAAKTQVKLYVVSHNEVEIPSATYLYPIRSDRMDGDNIAEKTNYCELRAQYWIWKNERMDDRDYIGFFHYRRYLELDSQKLYKVMLDGKRPIPYRIDKRPNIEMYSNPNIETFLNGFDVIAPVWEYTGVSVWKRYQSASAQQLNELKIIYEIILKNHSDFLQAADNYLSGKGEYYGNIYIMRWNRFQKYCSWLFGILEEFDRRVPNALPYTDGHLGERLFGIYFTWLAKQKEIHCGELPRLHFSMYDDKKHHSRYDYLLNIILQPGSAIRADIRKIVYKLRGKWYG